ncbi:Ethylene-responsive transcription factor [Cardamine amara subsp. amara]|uniref:Ethylene-responsive transcription factor n=1 Tax=Cardamine amara subsp. amara TaxID=228776 RepID=A0ABD1BCU7_CARAN
MLLTPIESLGPDVSLGSSSFCFHRDRPPENNRFVPGPISSCLQEQQFFANSTNSFPHCCDHDHHNVGSSKEIPLPSLPNDMTSSFFGHQDNTDEQSDADQMKMSCVLSDEPHFFEYDYTENYLQSFLKDVNGDPTQVLESSSSFI